MERIGSILEDGGISSERSGRAAANLKHGGVATAKTLKHHEVEDGREKESLAQEEKGYLRNKSEELLKETIELFYVCDVSTTQDTFVQNLVETLEKTIFACSGRSYRSLLPTMIRQHDVFYLFPNVEKSYREKVENIVLSLKGNPKVSNPFKDNRIL